MVTPSVLRRRQNPPGRAGPPVEPRRRDPGGAARKAIASWALHQRREARRGVASVRLARLLAAQGTPAMTNVRIRPASIMPWRGVKESVRTAQVGCPPGLSRLGARFVHSLPSANPTPRSEKPLARQWIERTVYGWSALYVCVGIVVQQGRRQPRRAAHLGASRHGRFRTSTRGAAGRSRARPRAA